MSGNISVGAVRQGKQIPAPANGASETRKGRGHEPTIMVCASEVKFQSLLCAGLALGSAWLPCKDNVAMH